jgi:hypothetical protein
MMKTETAVDLADRLARRRARIFTMLGIYFLAGQAVFFPDMFQPNGAARFKIAAWLVWALVLLLVLATGGGWSRGRAVRRLMEDEVTLANRRKAYSVGFWAAAGACVLVYLLTMIEPVSGREAVHLILTAAVAGALLSFAKFERRSLRDG